MKTETRPSKGFSKPRGQTRAQTRAPIELGVRISGHAGQPGIENTFTENVSAGGARVMSSRPWRLNERLIFATATGSFSAAARVVYCRPLTDEGFAVGLEFVGTPRGRWVFSGPA